MTANDARRAHALLDGIINGHILGSKDVDHLRSFLPELPKQKTLEEIYKYVDDAWLEADDPESKEWLHELHAQLQGLKDTPATIPALPAGMRIAEHENFGRVVTSPKPDQDGVYVLLVPRPKVETGADWDYAHECELTFIDAAPAKPVHPEFLETEGDYANAPRGTVAAKDGWNAWLKETDGVWSCGGGSDEESRLAQTGKRRVLRWGWKNERP